MTQSIYCEQIIKLIKKGDFNNLLLIGNINNVISNKYFLEKILIELNLYIIKNYNSEENKKKSITLFKAMQSINLKIEETATFNPVQGFINNDDVLFSLLINNYKLLDQKNLKTIIRTIENNKKNSLIDFCYEIFKMPIPNETKNLFLIDFLFLPIKTDIDIDLNKIDFTNIDLNYPIIKKYDFSSQIDDKSSIQTIISYVIKKTTQYSHVLYNKNTYIEKMILALIDNNADIFLNIDSANKNQLINLLQNKFFSPGTTELIEKKLLNNYIDQSSVVVPKKGKRKRI